jgi:sugar phosphate isomerase/epimerase
MRVGVNQFSYHRFFGETTPWETDPGVRWTLPQFLDRAVALGVDLVSLQTAYLGSIATPVLADELAARHLDFIIVWGHPAGLEMGTSLEAASNLRQWIRKTSGLGGKVLRIVAGHPKYRGPEPISVQISRVVPLLRELGEEASAHGLVLALENHADFTPAELVEVIVRVGRPQLRAAFDTGNCVRLGAPLCESCKHIAPITEIVHLKDLLLLEASLGDPNSSWPSAPLGKGSFDLVGVLRHLEGNGFDGPLLVELSHMHPNWPDEDKAVWESVQWLRAHLPQPDRSRSRPRNRSNLKSGNRGQGRERAGKVCP